MKGLKVPLMTPFMKLDTSYVETKPIVIFNFLKNSFENNFITV